MNNLNTMNYLDSIVEQIKTIDTTYLPDLPENVSDDTVNTIIEEQRTFFWIRLYIKDEQPNIEVGDDVTIHYIPSGEKMTTKFICYGKQGLDKDNGELVTHYNTEDDKKVLCLMIDEKMVNFSEDIPFIRTLFKTGRHFEYQLVRRDELLFIIDKNNIILDYYDTSF
jgi:hypothetical protein